MFSRLPWGEDWYYLVTIQGGVPFRRHHMSRRARLGSRARGSYSYHTRSLRRDRRGDNCGWCGRGVVRGADQAPAVKQEACPSAVSCQVPRLVQQLAEVGPHRLGFFVQVVSAVAIVPAMCSTPDDISPNAPMTGPMLVKEDEGHKAVRSPLQGRLVSTGLCRLGRRS